MSAAKKGMSLSNWINLFESHCSPACAFSWDNPGLQAGDPEAEVKSAAVALEATRQTVRETAKRGCQLLLVHHPLLFKPLQRIDCSSPDGSILAESLQRNVAIYAAHTNCDLSEGSMSCHVGRLLQLNALQPAVAKPQPGGLKVAAFVPRTHLDVVRKAMSEAGAGNIGNYTECSFSIPGTGTFFGREGSQPVVGQAGQLETAQEYRLEMVTPPSRLGRVLTALVRTHPYEEPAYDIYPVQSFLEEAHAIWTGSLGRPVRADSLARRVRKLLECSSVRLAGDPACQVKQVAICAGGGKSLLKKAASLKADLFITGDIDYHSARLAESLGLTVLDAGHFPTEKFFPELCSTALGRLPGLKDLRYVPLPVEKDPFQAF